MSHGYYMPKLRPIGLVGEVVGAAEWYVRHPMGFEFYWYRRQYARRQLWHARHAAWRLVVHGWWGVHERDQFERRERQYLQQRV